MAAHSLASIHTRSHTRHNKHSHAHTHSYIHTCTVITMTRTHVLHFNTFALFRTHMAILTLLMPSPSALSSARTHTLTHIRSYIAGHWLAASYSFVLTLTHIHYIASNGGRSLNWLLNSLRHCFALRRALCVRVLKGESKPFVLVPLHTHMRAIEWVFSLFTRFLCTHSKVKGYLNAQVCVCVSEHKRVRAHIIDLCACGEKLSEKLFRYDSSCSP